MGTSKISIIVQHFHGCPNGPKLLANLVDAMKDNENNINFVEVIVDTPELALLYKFRGSPTLLINGTDFENMLEPDNPSLSCRYYPNGIPTVTDIKNKIESLLIR